jgi:hypothetical protein
MLRLSLLGRGGGATVDTPFDGMTLAGPVKPVTIQGQPGRMALAAGDEGTPTTGSSWDSFPTGRSSPSWRRRF